MRTGHLFAGGGGGLYADLILGHTPIFAVEWDPYACAVLRSRAADGWFPGLRVHEGDVRLFDPSEYAGRVDCLHAGFPCQDISPAGRGEGINGKRSGLYREVLRVAGIVRPRYLFLENSANILSRGLGTVLGDLAELGYDAKWTVLAAGEVGAPHQRDRWWCLCSHADHAGQRQGEGAVCEPQERDNAGRIRADVGNATGLGWHAAPDAGSREDREPPRAPRGSGGDLDNSLRGRYRAPEGEIRPGREPAILPGWWATEPGVGRVVDGMATTSDEIKCLGNGQVSLCAAAAWKILGGPS